MRVVVVVDVVVEREKRDEGGYLGDGL